MTLFLQFSLDTGLHHIMCENYGRTAYAGPRILRAPPHPDVRWEHENEEEAEKDLAKLRAYFAALPAAKKTKKKSTAHGAFEE